jgi:hypothetical protein
MRAQPTRRGLGAPSLARRLITLPVVPHDTAATQTRASPRSIAPVVYGREGRYRVAVARLIEEWAGIELRSKPGDPA